MIFFDAARAIGAELSASAFRDEEHRLCNWMGRADRRAEVPGGMVPAVAALEADLYRGSAGVALFLAELAALTGEREAREVALGALRRSFAVLGRHPLERASPLSLFSGHLGVAVVGRRIGELFPEAAGEIAAEVSRLRPALEEALEAPHPLDYLGGSAGAVTALLRLARATGESAWAELARRSGEELAEAAEQEGEAVRWDARRLTGPFGETPESAAMPTGLSHGASGIALALLELHAETGEERHLELARGAFAYEDSHLDPEAGNWRDARSSAEAPAFSTAWCHGAPGIALARLRAMELDPERRAEHAERARIALETTAATLERLLEEPRHDATLCHGTAGLSEILLGGGRRLEEPRWLAAARHAARTLVERHGERGDWPSGIPSAGPTPALWLGTSGIGHHLLRLHAPDRVPAILVLEAA